jgi:site-specific DNA recombinase
MSQNKAAAMPHRLCRTDAANAAILCRVSGEEQKDNSSHDRQERVGREYCARKGYNVVTVKREAFSGAFVLARSDYNELLSMAADGRISVIVVDIPDRLGRGDVIAKCELLAELNGARVEYATPGRDTNTVEGMVLKATDQLVSGIERLNIRRRFISGKYERARQGRIIATHHRPYGYKFHVQRNDKGKVVSSELVIVPDEAATMKRMYEWLVYEGVTVHGIAKRLNALGIPTMSMLEGNHGRRAAVSEDGKGQWRASTVASMFKRTTYKGEWRYGKVECQRIDAPGRIKQKQIVRSADQTVVVPCPAIVDSTLWDMAQDQLKANDRKFRRQTIETYLLRGRIHCAHCGQRMFGQHKKRKNGNTRYYRCGRAADGRPIDRCPARQVRADDIEETVWELVSQAVLDVDNLIAGWREIREETQRARRNLEMLIATLEAENQKTQGKLSKLLDLHLSDTIGESEYRAKRHELESETGKRDAQVVEYRERLAEMPALSPETELELRVFAAAIKDKLAGDVPDTTKEQIFDLLNLEVVFNASTNEVTASGYFGHSRSAQLSCRSRRADSSRSPGRYAGRSCNR